MSTRLFLGGLFLFSTVASGLWANDDYCPPRNNVVGGVGVSVDLTHLFTNHTSATDDCDETKARLDSLTEKYDGYNEDMAGITQKFIPTEKKYDRICAEIDRMLTNLNSLKQQVKDATKDGKPAPKPLADKLAKANANYRQAMSSDSYADIDALFRSLLNQYYNLQGKMDHLEGNYNTLASHYKTHCHKSVPDLPSSAWVKSLSPQEADLRAQKKISDKHAAEWQELADSAREAAAHATDPATHDSWIADAEFDEKQAAQCEADSQSFHAATTHP